MKKGVIILFLLSSLLLQSCGGVSQKEYDELSSQNKELSEQLEEKKNEYKELLDEHKSCLDEKLKSASSDLDYAFPKSLASTYLCDDFIILSENNDYIEIVCKNSYKATKNSISGINDSVKKMISGIVYMKESLVFDRMCFKFFTDDGEELLSYTFKKDSDTYKLESMSMNVVYSDIITPALSSN